MICLRGGISVGPLLYAVLQQGYSFHMCDHRSPGKETSEYENLESDTIDDEDEKKENAEIESFEREEKRIVEEVERQVRILKGSNSPTVSTQIPHALFLEANVHVEC
jgi:hypothetical protein